MIIKGYGSQKLDSLSEIQKEEAKNPTPVESKPAVTRKPAAKKAEPKAVDPEEEEKKKKRYFQFTYFIIFIYRQEEAEKRRAEMKAAMQKKPSTPKEDETPAVQEEPLPVQEESPRAPEIDDVPLPTSKPKMGGEAPSWEEYMKQIQEEEAKNPTPVESKPAAVRKPAVKKAEPKAVDPEEEEKKKKRFEN